MWTCLVGLLCCNSLTQQNNMFMIWAYHQYDPEQHISMHVLCKCSRKMRSLCDANFVIDNGTTGCHMMMLTLSSIMAPQVVIMMMSTLSSMMAPQVVIMTTCCAISDDKVGIITILSFQVSWYQLGNVFAHYILQVTILGINYLIHL